VYWFSQTIGPDRGLEVAVEAVGRAQSQPHLYLRGSPAKGFVDKLQSLAAYVNAAERLHFLPPEPPIAMVRLAAAYDVGLSAETGSTGSRKIALTNKIFTYLLAGIPAITSDVPAYRDFALEAGDATRLYSTENVDSLATAIDEVIGNPQMLAQARAAAFRLGQSRFNWDLEAVNLLRCIDAATIYSNATVFHPAISVN